MQDDPTDEACPLEASRCEAIVMLMLLYAGHRWPWSMAEVSRELGDELRAMEAVAGLHAAGLVHRCGEFVVPSRPATRLQQLEDALLAGDPKPRFGAARAGRGAD